MKTLIICGVFYGTQLVSNLSASIVVGTGNDFSLVGFETPNIGVLQYEVRYDFDESVSIGTSDLLRIIAAEDSSINFDILGSSNEFLSAITFNGVREEGSEVAPMVFTFFEQFVAGGQAGAESFGVPAPEPISQNAFVGGLGITAPFRIIEPGSSDAFVFGLGGTAPSFAPIPEPSAAVLLSTLCLFSLRRRR